MNKCILIGNLTRDPEVTTTANGVTVCKFSIAVGRNFTNASGEKETDFFNIVAWRGIGENCGKFLTKGSKVSVSGQIQIRTYEVDGQKRYATEIVAEEVEFLSSRQTSDESKTEPSQKQTQSKPKTTQNTPVGDDGLPF